MNDTGGHALGDRVICAFATMLNKQLRTEDLLGRIGGDEFCIVFPGLPATAAAACMERMRLMCERRFYQREDGSQFAITCSAGIAAYHSGMASHEELLKVADKALYEAKEQGRNRIVIGSTQGV